jgi:hypothetical protein
MNFKDCNKLVRKYIQERGFNVVGYISSIELLDTFVYSFTTEYNTKFFGKVHHEFGVTFSQLQNMFGN